MPQQLPETVILGPDISLEALVAVARYGAKIEFSADYCERVTRSRLLVEQWVEENRKMYGVTTGFGALCNKVISKEETARLQRNIILSHATSVGEPFSIEQARATMLMVLQNLGRGFSGVRLVLLERYKEFLNCNLVPWMPREGSVGYLSPEAHMALVLMGEGKAYYNGELLPGDIALSKAGMEPMELSAKEGLALVSGTTSVTALASLALYDLIQAAKSADVIAAITLESTRGLLRAFDERAMQVRPHPQQQETAANVRAILSDSEIMVQSQNARIQDALSLRCIPQLHGAAKKTLFDALKTLEIEINSCCDNPIVWSEPGEEDVISACNPDSSFVGIEMDSACIAATCLAKMSERRNNRMIDGTLSGHPWFLIQNPGLNSGLMIPQYTQAGLLGDMRILSTPATIDNTPTCGNQEDYVAMGYNAAKKAVQIAEKLEYILAIELLSGYASQVFLEKNIARSTVTKQILDEIGQYVPLMEQDVYLHPYMEYLREFIHSGELLKIAEQGVGRSL